MGTIVVGVDGSPGSDAALRWAADEARLRGAQVRAVHVYEVAQTLVGDASIGAAGIPAPALMTPAEAERARSNAEEQARGVVQSAVDRIGGDVPDRSQIEVAALPGAPAQTLIEAGRNAELLVLGSRGRGGFLGLLLGSVTQQVSHHPPCPLVIVPTGEESR